MISLHEYYMAEIESEIKNLEHLSFYKKMRLKIEKSVSRYKRKSKIRKIFSKERLMQ